MRKHCLFFIFLVILIQAAAADVSPESFSISTSTEVATPVSAEALAAPSSEAAESISAEALAAPSAEAVRLITPEVSASPESSVLASKESSSTPPPGIIPPAEIPPAEIKPPEEGASYKGVPWGCDFKKFKEIKGFSGSLDSFSAAFVNSADDNDIALLLGAPVSGKGAKGEQRIMFEYVPQKFASAYFEPEDVFYIFYDGKFAMVFSRIGANNFDLYRDNFYKKYEKTGTVARQFMPAANKKYKLNAIKFEKGKTNAFLIKGEVQEKERTAVSAKMIFVFDELFNTIQKEIQEKMSGEKQSKGEKAQQELERDLKKIE